MSRANFDSIITYIFPRLTNGHRPTKEDITDVLNEVAVSYDGVNWELKGTGELAKQVALPLISEKWEQYEMPSTVHNQNIYRLAILCQKAGFVPYIGKQERNDPMLAGLKPLTHLNVKAEPVQQKRIEQIDISWAQSDGTPVWAFEVEEHTSILSALERFVALLSAMPALGKSRQLTIVAPKARRRKLQQELTSSSYIGHPQYLENKITYMFYDDLEAAFSRYSHRANLRFEEFHALCHLPPTSDSYLA